MHRLVQMQQIETEGQKRGGGKQETRALYESRLMKDATREVVVHTE